MDLRMTVTTLIVSVLVSPTKDLSIGPVSGSYPGMPQTRTFNVVWVGQGHGIGNEG